MRCLVTGAKGLLGSELVRYLEDVGDEVVAWDLPDNDITDVEKTISNIHLVRPDTIFHLAAWTDVDACESDRARAALVNFQGTWGVAMGAAEVGAQLLYVSTDYVFSGRSSRPYRETDKPDPISVYGRTKLMGEQAVLRTCKRRFVVRTAWLYGRAGHCFVDRISERARDEAVIRVVSGQTGAAAWAR
ncbi:MAG: sugar nucleotide-binding protein, partial [candidate division WOR-3 bacterium]